MAAPYEIIGAPYTVWIAPVATAFPLIDAAPAGTWKKLGTSGDKNYDEDGVTVTHGQNIETFTPAGSTVPRKAFRTEEGVTVGLNLADLSPEQYALALNNAAVTTVAASGAVAGEKSFSIYQGPNVATFAMLVRGPSSINDALNAQYELASVYQNGEPAPQFTKGAPALLELEFAVIDAAGDGNVGTLRIQSAPKVV